MLAYRAKKKQQAAKVSIAGDPIGNSLTSARSEAAKKSKKRQQEQEKRRAMRDKIKQQKEREAMKRKNAVLWTQKWRLRVKLSKTNKEQPLSLEDRGTTRTERWKIRQIKDILPKTPTKRAKIVHRLTQSPSCSKMLQAKHKSRSGYNRRIAFCDQLEQSISETVEELRCSSGGVSGHGKERAMSGITRIVSRIKGKYGLQKKLHLRGKVKQLRQEAWWQEKPRQHRKDRPSETSRHQVRIFFRSPEISREFPDKKKVLKIKTNEGMETVILKRSMTSTMKEAYEVFKQLHPNIKLGLTLFKKLKPKEIVHVSETSLRSCLCQDCANTSSKLQAIKKFAQTTDNYKNLDVRKEKVISTSLCSFEGDFADLDCYKRQCDNCSADQVKDHFKSMTDEHGDTEIKWHKWAYVEVYRDGAKKRIVTCVVMNSTLSDLIDALFADLQRLPIHLFRATWQHRQIGRSIASLQKKPKSICLVMDFAENYSCRQQNEVQSAYFDQTQVVIHPMMAYYHRGNQLIKHTMVGVTDDYKKDAHLVEEFLKAALRILEEEVPELEELHIWSDGCSAQYKGKVAFWYLAQRRVRTVHNFF